MRPNKVLLKFSGNKMVILRSGFIEFIRFFILVELGDGELFGQSRDSNE